MLNTGSSAWGVRARMALYAKGPEAEAQLDLVAPDGPLNRPDFKSRYRFGRVPTLWVDDTVVLQESEAIMEYFDERFPDPPLKPAAILDRARMRMLVRLTDDSVMGAMKVLFANRDPARRDAEAVARAMLGLNDGYDRVEHYMDGGDYALCGQLTLADCTLVPTIWLSLDFLPFFDAPSPFADRPKLSGYWDAIQAHPVVSRILGEMSDHLRAARAARIAEEAAVAAAG